MRALSAYLLLVLFAGSANAQVDVRQDLANKMRYLSQRQSVISQNIANANTPGYKAKDLAPMTFKSVGSSKRIKLMATQPGHVGAPRAGASKIIKMKGAYETAPDGNNVNLEQQTVAMAKNSLEYQQTVSVMRKLNDLIKSSIGDRQQ